MAVSFLDPLIKSQGQRGSKPNINKKAPTISRSTCFLFGNGRCIVLLRFRHKTSTAEIDTHLAVMGIQVLQFLQ